MKTKGHGLSEKFPVVCFNKPGHEQIGTVGSSLIETEVEIRDEDGKRLSIGEKSENCVRGP
ncbi:MAG: long-chain acyl-CoA synthetase, partial [Flavobacteriales bacterium]|jgi:long-chain acyl-CoA synthetase